MQKIVIEAHKKINKARNKKSFKAWKPFLLSDRITKIRSINDKYDLENNAYISYSAGKDSNVLSALIDIALPGNKIPRVYIDTGIELNAVREFERENSRFLHIHPKKNIRSVLETFGHPFKSKEHSCKLNSLKNGSNAQSIQKYFRIGEYKTEPNKYGCPKTLLYQRETDFSLHISDACCYKLKKEPVKSLGKESGRYIGIIGLRAAEGGQRGNKTNCVAFSGDKLHHFSPLLPMDDSWCEWFIDEYKIQSC